MRTTLLSLLFLLMPLALWAQDDTPVDYDRAPDGYYMKLQQVEMTVHRDRTYDVHEELYANFLVPSHGIYRSIPRQFWVNRDVSEAQDGSRHEMRYIGVSVDDLRATDSPVYEVLDDVVDVRLGSPDREIMGDYDFSLSYTLSLADDRVPVGDLFFHSVLGSSWTCATDSLHFIIHFDEEITRQSFEAMKVFVGREGSEDNRFNTVITHLDTHTIVGSASRLAPGEAVTIYLPLPEGYFDADGHSMWYYLSWLAAGVTLLMLIRVFYLIAQGDEKVAPVVTFHPRKGMTSADVGSLVDASVDDADLISLIPWFASEGYISIERQGADIYLHCLNPLPSDAPEYQQKFFRGLFADGRETFKVGADAKFGHAWESAKASLSKQYSGKLDDYGGIMLLFLTTVAFSLNCCWSQVAPDGWITGGIINVFLAIALVALDMLHELLAKHKLTSFAKGCSSIFGMIFAVVGVIFLVLLAAFSLEELKDTYIPTEVHKVLMALCFVAGFFQFRLTRMTEYRRQHLAEVLGLREFIETAQEDRLRMLLAKDEQYFYSILPYAVVFGMVEQWTAKFKDLTVPPKPEFSGYQPSNISSLVSTSQYRKTVSDSISAAHPASSGGSYGSSSGHSGGYSGGGSGGGGGRRW